MPLLNGKINVSPMSLIVVVKEPLMFTSTLVVNKGMYEQMCMQCFMRNNSIIHT